MTRRATGGGGTVEIWVQPRATRDQVAGVQGDAIKVRLAAPPVEGKANEALVRLLAKLLGVPRRGVQIVRGHSGRRKAVRVEGLGPEEIRTRLGV